MEGIIRFDIPKIIRRTKNLTEGDKAIIGGVIEVKFFFFFFGRCRDK